MLNLNVMYSLGRDLFILWGVEIWMFSLNPNLFLLHQLKLQNIVGHNYNDAIIKTSLFTHFYNKNGKNIYL